MKYFIDNEIYYQGKKMPPREVELKVVVPQPDGTSYCIDKDGDDYIIPLDMILER